MDASLARFVVYVESLVHRPDLEFLLYAVRPWEAPVFRPPDLSEWPQDTSYTYFLLQDEPWPIVVDLFQIRVARLPERYEDLLKAALADLIDQNAILAWYTFEGSFGPITHLFVLDTEEHIYGIAWPGQPPVLAITEEVRHDAAWVSLVKRGAAHLESGYPELRTALKTLYDDIEEYESQHMLPGRWSN